MSQPSLRRIETEAHYQHEKALGLTKHLRTEPVIWSSQHWVMIRNRYPYDGVFKQHDMLLPKRDFARANEMTAAEATDLRQTLDGARCADYHLFFENTAHRRSNLALFHLHLAAFHDSREEFKL